MRRIAAVDGKYRKGYAEPFLAILYGTGDTHPSFPAVTGDPGRITRLWSLFF